MTEKDKRILKYAIDNLVARENSICEGFCKNNPAHRAERERDRDFVMFCVKLSVLKNKRKRCWRKSNMKWFSFD